MIWFFLAGMIAGAVGFNMFIRWCAKRIIKRRQMEAFREKETGE